MNGGVGGEPCTCNRMPAIRETARPQLLMSDVCTRNRRGQFRASTTFDTNMIVYITAVQPMMTANREYARTAPKPLCSPLVPRVPWSVQWTPPQSAEYFRKLARQFSTWLGMYPWRVPN